MQLVSHMLEYMIFLFLFISSLLCIPWQTSTLQILLAFPHREMITVLGWWFVLQIYMSSKM